MAKKTMGNTGARALRTKIKKKRGLKNSSRRWLERHLNDPYVHRAKAEGYRSRAVFKLLEINERHDLIKPGQRVVDLGAAPGGWSQVLAQMVGSSSDDIRVAAIDFLEMDSLPGVAFLQMDFLDDAAPDALLEALGDAPDLVFSDMAAPTIGHRKTDHMRTMYLCEVAADFAIRNLKPGGHFLAKTFQGGTEKSLLDLLKKNFQSVHHVKPGASRAESVESFILAKSFKGRVHENAEHD